MTLNIAHRGFSGKYPENTLLAFKKAVEIKADGIELDVQLTKDNVPVIIHDEMVDRTTNSIGLVKNFTYKEIKRLNAGGNERIPSLEEFLELAHDSNIFVNLELKNSIFPYEGLEDIVLNLLEKYSISKEKLILSSFNHNSMMKIKEMDSSIKTGLLYESCLYKPYNYLKTTSASALHPCFASLLQNIDETKDLIKKNVEINTYTVNDVVYMKALIDLGVNGIITNYPDRLKELL